MDDPRDRQFALTRMQCRGHRAHFPISVIQQLPAQSLGSRLASARDPWSRRRRFRLVRDLSCPGALGDGVHSSRPSTPVACRSSVVRRRASPRAPRRAFRSGRRRHRLREAKQRADRGALRDWFALPRHEYCRRRDLWDGRRPAGRSYGDWSPVRSPDQAQYQTRAWGIGAPSPDGALRSRSPSRCQKVVARGDSSSAKP